MGKTQSGGDAAARVKKKRSEGITLKNTMRKPPRWYFTVSGDSSLSCRP